MLNTRLIFKQLPDFLRRNFKGSWKGHVIDMPIISWEQRMGKPPVVINGCDVHAPTVTRFFWRRGRRYGNGKATQGVPHNQLDCDPSQEFWIDDKPNKGIRRILNLVEDYHNQGKDDTLYVFSFSSDNERKAWEQHTGVDTTNFALVSSLPEPAKAIRQPRDPNGTYKTPSDYLVLKDFETNHGPNKAYWLVEQGKCPSAGVYLKIKHYNLCESMQIGHKGCIVSEMSGLIHNTRTLCRVFDMPKTLYGFTPRQVAKLGPGWKTLETYIKDETKRVAGLVSLTSINWGKYREASYSFLKALAPHLPPCSLLDGINAFEADFNKTQNPHPCRAVANWHDVTMTEVNFSNHIDLLEKLPLVKHFAIKDYYSNDDSILKELGEYVEKKLEVKNLQPS